jgi:hypothetical protein
MKRILIILAATMIAAISLGGFAIIYGTDAQAGAVADSRASLIASGDSMLDNADLRAGKVLKSAFPARHSISEHSHHYRHMMGHNLHRSVGGLHLMSINAIGGDEMCEGCGGNHPGLYSRCDKCQNNTRAACVDANTGYLVSCQCYCNHWGNCLWLRY